MALKWVFELDDKMSGPAKQIVINLNQVKDTTDQVKESAKETGGILDTALGTGLEKVAEKLFSVGKEFVGSLLQANRVAEQTKIAFEVMTGSTGQAEASFEELKRVAFAIGQPIEAVAASYKEMLSSGEAVTNLQLIAKAASDLSHTEGGSIEQWTKAFSDIRGKGELAGRSLAQFVGAVDFDVLSKKLGLTTHGYKQLTEALTKTPVSAQKGIQALLQTVAEGEGGSLETVSRKMRDTFSGTVATIKEQLLSLFQFDSENSSILELLHGVRDALNPDGPLVAKIREGAAAFMEGLGLITGPGGFDDLIKSLKDGSILGADFKQTMRSVGETVRDVAGLVGDLAKGLRYVALGIQEIKSPGSYAEKIRNTPGAELTPAARAEMKLLQAPPEERLEDLLGGGIVNESKKISRIPAMASGGHVDEPTLALIGEGGEGESVIPDSKLGGMSLHVEQHFHIEGAGGVDVQDLARHLHAISLPDLQGAMDSLAQSMGVT